MVFVKGSAQLFFVFFVKNDLLRFLFRIYRGCSNFLFRIYSWLRHRIDPAHYNLEGPMLSSDKYVRHNAASGVCANNYLDKVLCGIFTTEG